MAGTVADPVRLSPARNIREVQWPTPWAAFNIAVIRRTEDSDYSVFSWFSGGCTVPTSVVFPGEPLFGINFDNTFLTEARYEVLTGTDLLAYAPSLFHGGSWDAAPEFSVVGLPSLPETEGFPILKTVSWADWEQPAGATLQVRKAEWYPFGIWKAFTAGPVEDGPFPPGDPGGTFAAQVSNTFQMVTPTVTSGPTCFIDDMDDPVAFANLIGNEILSNPDAPISPGSPAVYNLSGVIAYSRAKPGAVLRAYKAAGLAVVGADTPPHRGIRSHNAGTLWVLCKRSPDDDLP